MRIFTEQTLKQYIESHPKSKVALQEWTSIIRFVGASGTKTVLFPKIL